MDEPAVEPDPELDVLERMEGELAAVERALISIDDRVYDDLPALDG